jgi:predicted nucleotidyltransferase/antitoxin (DNA-binding transcriptional repressor) of toxin-antitoxin stability system
MTKSDTRIVPVSEAPGLAALLDEVERGTTVVITRDGVPVAVLGPPSPGGALDPTTVANESRAAYGTAKAERGQPAPAMLRLVGGAAARSVLGVFVREPQRAIHQREIARRAGVGLRSAQLALERLESLGLIVSQRDGNRRNYQASRSSRFDELRGLLAREFGVAEAIARALESVSDRIVWAFIFGSAAQGRDALDSDVDLLVSGDVSRDELVAPIAEAQRELGREIDLVLYRPQELRDKRRQGDHFLAAVLAGPRVDVIGGSVDA